MLLCVKCGRGGRPDERLMDLADDVVLEATEGFPFGLALGAAPCDVPLGVLVLGDRVSAIWYSARGRPDTTDRAMVTVGVGPRGPQA